ncbi:hypothetical protein [Hyphomonas sp.]|uniref:hypothetical protein n=1 Tax=Hyphomonas sp. TaxID=87 RepID=UPI00300202AD
MRNIVLATTLLFASACGNAGGTSIEASTPLVIADGQAPVTYGQVTTGTPSLSPSILPAQPEAVRTNASCRTPKASSNARAAYVYTYGGGVRTPLHHINRKDTPEAIAERKAMIRESTKNAKTAMQREALGMAIGNAVNNARQIDVLVTETDTPVFLYLTSYDSVLWNIQRAPGVEIDGVVINSYEAGAIANGVDASRTGIISFDNSPTRKCYVSAPGRIIPVEDRVASARKLNPNVDLSRYKTQWQQEYRAAKRFYRQDIKKLTGKRPEWILNDARGGKFNAILVGPKPAAPFEAQPVTKLQVPSHITPFWGNRKDAYKAFGLDPSA